MKEFDYSLNYKELDFTNSETRRLYRIGRGEQGVLLVRPYTTDLCAIWRFKTPKDASTSAEAIYERFKGYLKDEDFVGADMARKFLEMGFTRSRRYANHKGGRKYDQTGKVLPQESDNQTSKFADCARIFKAYRDRAAKNEHYQRLRKEWRRAE